LLDLAHVNVLDLLAGWLQVIIGKLWRNISFIYWLWLFVDWLWLLNLLHNWGSLINWSDVFSLWELIKLVMIL